MSARWGCGTESVSSPMDNATGPAATIWTWMPPRYRPLRRRKERPVTREELHSLAKRSRDGDAVQRRGSLEHDRRLADPEGDRLSLVPLEGYQCLLRPS